MTRSFPNSNLPSSQRRRQHYGSRDGELGFWPTDAGRNREPVDVSADYLTCIHKFVEETFLPSTYGVEFLKNQRRVYLITVPAIWSDLAKDLTRQAAGRAGIPDEKLFLVTEPEAAALYCATTCEEVDLNNGDHFLVCDAGGGTVVLTIYQLNIALISGSHRISNCDESTIPDQRKLSGDRSCLWCVSFR